MDHAFVMQVSAILLESVLVLGGAILAGRTMSRASAALRHQVLAGAFVALLALPLLSLIVPTWDSPAAFGRKALDYASARMADAMPGRQEMAGSAPQADVPAREKGIAASGIPAGGSSSPVSMTGTGGAAKSGTASGVLSGPIVKALVEKSPIILLAAWVAGTVAILIVQFVGWAGAGFIAGMSTPVGDGPVKDVAEKIKWELGIKRPVKLVRSEISAVTMAWGIFDSCIILPSDSVEWSIEKVDAVLRHEMAHVKRRDNMILMIAVVASAIYWFNPLVWKALRRLHFEREVACDDFVVSSGTSPSAYARYLMEISVKLSGAKNRRIMPAAMAHSSSVKKRLLNVLDSGIDRRPAGMAISTISFLVILGAAIPAASLRPWETVSALGGTEIAGQALDVAAVEGTISADERGRSGYTDDELRELKKKLKELKKKETELLARERAIEKAESALGEEKRGIVGTADNSDGEIWNIEGTIYGADPFRLDDTRLENVNEGYVLDTRAVIIDEDSESGCRFESSKGFLSMSMKRNGHDVEYIAKPVSRSKLDEATVSCRVDGREKEMGEGDRQEYNRVLREVARFLESTVEDLTGIESISGTFLDSEDVPPVVEIIDGDVFLKLPEPPEATVDPDVLLEAPSPSATLPEPPAMGSDPDITIVVEHARAARDRKIEREEQERSVARAERDRRIEYDGQERSATRVERAEREKDRENSRERMGARGEYGELGRLFEDFCDTWREIVDEHSDSFDDEYAGQVVSGLFESRSSKIDRYQDRGREALLEEHSPEKAIVIVQKMLDEYSDIALESLRKVEGGESERNLREGLSDLYSELEEMAADNLQDLDDSDLDEEQAELVRELYETVLDNCRNTMEKLK